MFFIQKITRNKILSWNQRIQKKRFFTEKELFFTVSKQSQQLPSKQRTKEIPGQSANWLDVLKPVAKNKSFKWTAKTKNTAICNHPTAWMLWNLFIVHAHFDNEKLAKFYCFKFSQFKSKVTRARFELQN